MAIVKKFLQENMVAVVSGTAFLFALGGFVWAYFAVRGITGQPLILHFDDLQGITQVGGIGNLVGVGVFGLFVTVVDFFIARELDARDPFLGRFVAGLTLLFAILLFIAFAAILKVN